VSSRLRTILVPLGIVALLYLFLVSIGMVGASFKLLGKDAAQQIFGFAGNPLAGLFIGILATSLVQSSSTTTSIVVGLVAGGMPVGTAIPIIMGANIGTSVTNTLVSLGHIGRPNEFQRAFAASTVHDFFNLMAVLILFPLQYFTNFLGTLAGGMAGLLTGGADVKFHSPIKVVVKPVVKAVVELLGMPVDSHAVQAALVLALAAVLLFVSLKYITVLLKSVVLERASTFFERTVFRTPQLAFVVGIGLTILVQSSSITTSLVVPLAGAGLLTLAQIYPYTLGANVGTTVTAILAALAVPDHFLAAVTVAFSHLLFNCCGIAVITPIPPLRRLPMRMAEGLAAQAIRRRWVPVLYVVVVFFITPLVLLYATR
jgi:sodium-dependent phosphate cotransporter